MKTRTTAAGHQRVPLEAKLLLAMFLLSCRLATPEAAQGLFTLLTENATFGISSTGTLDTIVRRDAGRNYVAPGQPAPLLSIRVGGKLYAPAKAEWDPSARQLTLRFPEAAAHVVLTANASSKYVTFGVLAAEPAESIELIVWGPYPTTIKDIVGETVGVVRDDEFAIGIQALNVKTLGGYPAAENDAEGESSANDPAVYPDLPAEVLQGQHYRTDTARRTEFGSILQAYCRNREQEKVVANWGHPRYRVPAFRDGGVVGSRIALFASPSRQALEIISSIETGEGLPHPVIDGTWAKVARGATASYLIVDFSEATVDRAIEMTRRAGLQYLYHSSPFETWGHFRLKPSLFPRGWDGLRACVDKARSNDVRVGVHMLSNFITPNDPYVTPNPDPRLAWIGANRLTRAVDTTAREIPVLGPEYFTNKSALNTVRVGRELIRFGSVSAGTPLRLLDCERGAWGTQPAAHKEGDPVARLLDHDYKVFLSDADLSQEIARNLADLFNRTGLLQTSFDGLEGNWSTGYGKYGCALFVKAWYEALEPGLQGRVINDASLPGHFNWHVNTRMNWGEPWYGGFRESQTLYRFKNQVYFERNLMPHMLGWFALRPDTSIEDAEWLLARAAGFNAGFALATSLASTAQLAADPTSADTSRRYGATPAILEAIRQWETARMAGVFPPALREGLRDNTREFHLQARPDRAWDLQEVHVTRFTAETNRGSVMECRFSGPRSDQEFHWIVRSTSKEPVPGLTIKLNDATLVDLGEVPLPPGGSLKGNGGDEAVVYDAKWNEQARVRVAPESLRQARNDSVMVIRSASASAPALKLELRLLDPATRISR